MALPSVELVIVAIKGVAELIRSSKLNNSAFEVILDRMASINEALSRFNYTQDEANVLLFQRLENAVQKAKDLYQDFTNTSGAGRFVGSLLWKERCSLLNDLLDRCIIDLNMFVLINMKSEAQKEKINLQSDEELARVQIRKLIADLEDFSSIQQTTQRSNTNDREAVTIATARTSLMIDDIIEGLLEPLDRCNLLAAKRAQDVRASLTECREQLENNVFRTCIVGPMKAGKSSLLNLIVGYDIAPNHFEGMTAIPTVIKHDPSKHLNELTLEIPQPDFFARDLLKLREFKVTMLKPRTDDDDGLPFDPTVQFSTMEQEVWAALEVISIPRETTGLKEIQKLLKILNILVRMSLKYFSQMSPFALLLNEDLRTLNTCWPIVRCNFAFLCQQPELANCNFEVVDTPGLGEQTVGPWLKLIVSRILQSSDAVVCVLDTSQLQSQPSVDAIHLALGNAAISMNPDKLFDNCYFLANKWDVALSSGVKAWEPVRENILKCIHDDISLSCAQANIPPGVKERIQQLRREQLISGDRVGKLIAKDAIEASILRRIVEEKGEFPDLDLAKLDTLELSELDAIVHRFAVHCFGAHVDEWSKKRTKKKTKCMDSLHKIHVKSGVQSVLDSIFLRCAMKARVNRGNHVVSLLKNDLLLWTRGTVLALERLVSDDSKEGRKHEQAIKQLALYTTRAQVIKELNETQVDAVEGCLQATLQHECEQRNKDMMKAINGLFSEPECSECTAAELDKFVVGLVADSNGKKLGAMLASMALLPGMVLALTHLVKGNFDKEKLNQKYLHTPVLKFEENWMMQQKVNQFCDVCNGHASTQTLRIERSIGMELMTWKTAFDNTLRDQDEDGLDPTPTLRFSTQNLNVACRAATGVSDCILVEVSLPDEVGGGYVSFQQARASEGRLFAAGAHKKMQQRARDRLAFRFFLTTKLPFKDETVVRLDSVVTNQGKFVLKMRLASEARNFESADVNMFNPAEKSTEVKDETMLVTCDSCRTYPILGPRFQCTVCVNYELCANCEGFQLWTKVSKTARDTPNLHTREHLMVKINNNTSDSLPVDLNSPTRLLDLAHKGTVGLGMLPWWHSGSKHKGPRYLFRVDVEEHMLATLERGNKELTARMKQGVLAEVRTLCELLDREAQEQCEAAKVNLTELKRSKADKEKVMMKQLEDLARIVKYLIYFGGRLASIEFNMTGGL